MRRHQWRTVFSPGRARGSFDARASIGDVDVPAAVLARMDDSALAAGQLCVAGHTLCASTAFAAPLVHASRSVAGRVAVRIPFVSAHAAPGRG